MGATTLKRLGADRRDRISSQIMGSGANRNSPRSAVGISWRNQFIGNLWGGNGNCQALWRVETSVTPSVSFSIPPRNQAFWPDGSAGGVPQFPLRPYTQCGGKA
jgi:hypothetical protein